MAFSWPLTSIHSLNSPIFRNVGFFLTLKLNKKTQARRPGVAWYLLGNLNPHSIKEVGNRIERTLVMKKIVKKLVSLELRNQRVGMPPRLVKANSAFEKILNR